MTDRFFTSYLYLTLLPFFVLMSTNELGDSHTKNTISCAPVVTPFSIQAGFLPTVINKKAAPAVLPEGMVWIPGGEFSMGSDESNESLCDMPGTTYDAKDIHRVRVDGFFMDATEVTNEEYARFVKSTGYVTVAEKKPSREEFPDIAPENLVAGSTVFSPTKTVVPLNNYLLWWTYETGADWRHPTGRNSSIKGKGKYPVVQLAYEDAWAYAKWAGKSLPTEAEWEFAARGGLSGKLYAWGNELKPGGKWQANIYEGKFPLIGGDSGADGFKGIAPVAQYKPNGYGLYDVAGNVWEWCYDWYSSDYYSTLAKTGKVAINPKGPKSSYDPAGPDELKKVHRGGSFLCTDLYCSRYLVGSRGKGEVKTASNHVGFRCIRRVA
jgi:sulfatase modifying factor 1